MSNDKEKFLYNDKQQSDNIKGMNPNSSSNEILSL